MIIAYILSKSKLLTSKKIHIKSKPPEGVVWIDLFQPTIKEEEWIKRYYNVSIPSSEKMDRIEVTTPFYQEGSAYYMTATIVDRSNTDYLESSAITFILNPKYLITLRYDNKDSLSKIGTYNHHFAYKSVPGSAPALILLNILEMLIHGIGDILEKTGNELDDVLKRVFEKTEATGLGTDRTSRTHAKHYNDIIKNSGRKGNNISKNCESLVSINRMLIYFTQLEDAKYMSHKDYRVRIKNLGREIYSMNEYATFLSQRNAFLLDATLGMLSVEQNFIIKIFTVAAAVFMPPTLIASIYGMNFHNMPELSLKWGYPMAITIIIVSAILPYLFFKKKGWI